MSHLPVASAAEIGWNDARLETAYALLRAWTDRGEVGGASLIVGRRGRTVAPRFFGRMGPDPGDEPIRDDALFLMASITKPIVYWEPCSWSNAAC